MGADQVPGWLRRAVAYEVYPQSFAASGGTASRICRDGIFALA
jgi:hypothetical protein